ncbi:MAG: hypothetical protein MJ247_05620 [Alphaproteobacteria bacterium]|nr:hypothetical protein [Alphaproteobacteria bacterium]
MSKSVSDFFDKGSVKKFKSGIKSFLDSSATKVATASIVLATAFSSCTPEQMMHVVDHAFDKQTTEYAITEKGDTICSYQAIGSKSDRERIAKIVNAATKSETGCAILKGISQNNATISFEEASDCTGFYDQETNSICLNPYYTNARLESNLIHEGKHSIQYANLSALNLGTDIQNTNNTFFSNTLVNRVMEADACATQAKFCYEMNEAGIKEPMNEMSRAHPSVMKSFIESAEKLGKDNKETLKQTMLSWYDDVGYVASYDNSMLDLYYNEMSSSNSNVDKNDIFSKEANKVISSICTQNDGKAYATDGNLLKTSKTAYLVDYVYDRAERVETIFRDNKTDLSIYNMYRMDTDTYKIQNSVNAVKTVNLTKSIQRSL